MDFVDNKPDKETVSPEENILINQEFTLFSPERTFADSRGGGTRFTRFKLLAELPDEEKIEFHVYTTPLTSGTLDTLLTPFSPELGHIIDNRDFDLDARTEQAIKSKKTPNNTKKIDGSLGLYWLSVEGSVKNLNKDPKSRLFSLPAGSPLNLLRLILTFPTDIALEARLRAIPAKIKPTVSLDNFYPVDARPLATKTGFDMVGDSILQDGMAIAFHLNEIQAIRARFVKFKLK